MDDMPPFSRRDLIGAGLGLGAGLILPDGADRDAVAALMAATIARWNAEPAPGSPDLRAQSESLRRIQELSSKMVNIDIQPASAAPDPK